MLRTNDTFLNYVEELYEKQIRKEEIILKKYSKGERILVQGENTSKVMFIKEGFTKCYFTEDNDKEYIFEFLGQGEVIGDIEFVRHVPCLCTIEAMSDVMVYAFSRSYFQQLLDADLKMNSLLIKVFADRISHTATRAAYQQLYTIEYSLRKLLELQEKQNRTISKEEMASYLGISLRSLNRGLKNLAR